MSDAAANNPIPNDLAACQALIEQHTFTIEELQQKIEKLEQEKQELKLAFDELMRRAFQKRSERYINDPSQLRLDFGDSDEAADATAGLAEAVAESQQTVPEHTRRRPGRKPRSEGLPEHLPRYEVEAEVPDAVKHCAEQGKRSKASGASRRGCGPTEASRFR